MAWTLTTLVVCIDIFNRLIHIYEFFRVKISFRGMYMVLWTPIILEIPPWCIAMQWTRCESVDKIEQPTVTVRAACVNWSACSTHYAGIYPDVLVVYTPHHTQKRRYEIPLHST